MKSKKNFIVLLLSLFLLSCNNTTSKGTNATGVGYYRTDGVVAGIPYQCGAYYGTTLNKGEFRFEYNKSCRFFIDRATIREFVPPNMEAVEVIDSNSTVTRFLASLDNDGNNSNGITITAATLKTIKNGILERVPSNDDEILMVVDFLQTHESSYHGGLIVEEKAEKLQLDNFLNPFYYMLAYQGRLIDITLYDDFIDLRILFPDFYSTFMLKKVSFEIQENQLILDQEPFQLSEEELETLKNSLNEMKDEEILREEWSWSYYENMTQEEQNRMLQELEERYANAMIYLSEMVSITQQPTKKIFRLEDVDPNYLLFLDEKNQTFVLFNDYEKAQKFMEDPSSLSLNKQESNATLLFIKVPPPSMVPSDFETPTIEMEAPQLDWGVPEPDDMTTFDGIRGEVKRKDD